jgi:hypothetical protein
VARDETRLTDLVGIVEYGDLPNAVPYPRLPVADDDEAIDDELDDDEALAEQLPPVRAFKPSHRQHKPKVEIAPAGPSPWERPRENFTATMTERVPEMRATKQASYVKGTSREA